MGLLETIRTALSALSAHKLRTVLSILGVVIGVAAVVAIVAIVQGATFDIREQIAGLGVRVINVTLFPDAILQGGQPAGFLIEEISEEIQAAPAVAKVVPSASASGEVFLDGQSFHLRLLGTTPEYAPLFDFYPAEGRFLHFLDQDKAVIVLGSRVAQDLFGGEDALGKDLVIDVWGQKTLFRVVGVMSSRGWVGHEDLDGQVYVPVSVLQRLGGLFFSSYIALAESEELVEKAARQIEVILDRKFDTLKRIQGRQAQTTAQAIGPGGGMFRGIGPGERRALPLFHVWTQREIIQAFEQISRTMMLVLGGIGAISLLVGGIGIMNIMLVSVTERTREVGIRMAVGARPRTILWQFLSESVLTCLAGGLAGLGLGWLGAWVASQLVGAWPFVISFLPAGIAFGFSVFVGIVFGLYPALRAARLDPVEALGYE